MSAEPLKPKQITKLATGANPITTDKIGKSLDLKLTTTDGIIKTISEELLFKSDSLEGINSFKGQVYRVTKNIGNTIDEQTAFIAKFFFTEENLDILKVRIPEVHGHLPIPGTFNETEEDSKIIDLYPDFIVEPEAGQSLSVSVGDIVEVTFGNLATFTDGKVIKKYGTVTSAQGSIAPVGSGTSESAKKDIQKKFEEKAVIDNEPLTAENSGTEEAGEDAYEKGKNIGKIKLKAITDTEKLKAEAADQFLKMVEAAKKDKITLPSGGGIGLKVNDGFRSFAEQKAIYDERYTNGVKNEIGKIKGPAAKPGFSNHQNGIAVDISTGGFDSKTYAWLDKNAGTYGFTNTGKNFTKKEAWHWEYKPSNNVKGGREGDAVTVAEQEKAHKDAQKV
jgi:LAS superfamily LD-carboxypeptidase LdcB